MDIVIHFCHGKLRTYPCHNALVTVSFENVHPRFDWKFFKNIWRMRRQDNLSFLNSALFSEISDQAAL